MSLLARDRKVRELKGVLARLQEQKDQLRYLYQKKNVEGEVYNTEPSVLDTGFSPDASQVMPETEESGNTGILNILSKGIQEMGSIVPGKVSTQKPGEVKFPDEYELGKDLEIAQEQTGKSAYELGREGYIVKKVAGPPLEYDPGRPEPYTDPTKLGYSGTLERPDLGVTPKPPETHPFGGESTPIPENRVVTVRDPEKGDTKSRAWYSKAYTTAVKPLVNAVAGLNGLTTQELLAREYVKGKTHAEESKEKQDQGERAEANAMEQARLILEGRQKSLADATEVTAENKIGWKPLMRMKWDETKKTAKDISKNWDKIESEIKLGLAEDMPLWVLGEGAISTLKGLALTNKTATQAKRLMQLNRKFKNMPMEQRKDIVASLAHLYRIDENAVKQGLTASLTIPKKAKAMAAVSRFPEEYPRLSRLANNLASTGIFLSPGMIKEEKLPSAEEALMTYGFVAGMRRLFGHTPSRELAKKETPKNKYQGRTKTEPETEPPFYKKPKELGGEGPQTRETASPHGPVGPNLLSAGQTPKPNLSTEAQLKTPISILKNPPKYPKPELAEGKPGDIARSHKYVKTLEEENIDAFGVANKKRLREVELPEAEEAGKFVMIYDIDNFKAINEGYGHNIGDDIIQASVNYMAESFPNDIIGKFGGDENVVIFNSEPTEEQIKKFVQEFPEVVQIEGQPVTISAGVAIGTDEKKLIADLVSNEAKQTGKNQAVLVDKSGKKIYIKGTTNLEKPYVREQDIREFRSVAERLAAEAEKLPPELRGTIERTIQELREGKPGNIPGESSQGSVQQPKPELDTKPISGSTEPDPYKFTISRSEKIREYLATAKKKSPSKITDEDTLQWHREHRTEEVPTTQYKKRSGNRDDKVTKKNKAQSIEKILDRMQRPDSEWDIPQIKVKIKDLPKEFSVDGNILKKWRNSWNFGDESLKRRVQFPDDEIYIDNPESITPEDWDNVFENAPRKEKQLDLFNDVLVAPSNVPEKKLPVPILRDRIKAKKNVRKLSTIHRASRGWNKNFIDSGYLNLHGRQLKTPQDWNDLIATIQVWRNPMYETHRIIFLKGDTILHHMAVTSKLPGQSRTTPKDPIEQEEFFKEVKEAMERMGADGYIETHNHNSGNVTPSKGDLIQSQFHHDKLPGYRYTFIINHNTYALLVPDKNGIVPQVTYHKIETGKPDPYDVQKFPKLQKAEDAINMAMDINTPERHIGLMFFNGQNRVTGVSSVHVNQFRKNPKQFEKTLRNMQRDFGASAVVASTPQTNMTLANELYDSGLFYDAITANGESATIQRGLPKLKEPETKFYRVREEEPSYDTNPPSPDDIPSDKKGLDKIKENIIRAKEAIQDPKKVIPKAILPFYRRWVQEQQVRLFDLAKVKNELERMASKPYREAAPFLIEGTEIPDILNRPDLQAILQDPVKRELAQKVADTGKKQFEKTKAYMIANLDDLPEEWIENYVTHIWDLAGKKQKQDAVKWFTTRNPNLQKRTIETIYKGIVERGFKPKTLDLAELVSIQGQNAIRTTENKLLLEGLVALQNEAGVNLILPAHKAPSDWMMINHPALNKTIFAGEGTVTAKVKLPRMTIIQTIEKIKTIETSGDVTVEGGVSGPMQKLESVVTEALQSRGMTTGESTQYLNRLKAAYAGKTVTGGTGENRTTETVNRRVNNILDEIEHKIEVKYPKLVKVPVKYHPSIAPIMRAIFSSPWKPDGKVGLAVAIWENGNAILKQTQLGLSLFHHIALGEAGIATMGPINTFKIVLNAKKMMAALNEKKFDMFMDKWVQARDAVKHGVVFGANLDVQKPLVDKLISETESFFRKTGIGKPLAEIMKGIGWGKEKWDMALWDYYHNNLKLYAYEHLVNKELQRYIKELGPGRTLFTTSQAHISKLKEEIAVIVNDTFGGQNWMDKIADPAFMRAFRASFLSPDWTVSTLRQASGAFGFGTKYPEIPGHKKIRKTLLWKFWMRALVYFGGGTAMLNYLITQQDDAEQRGVPLGEGKGVFPWDNDPGHETHILLNRDKEGGKVYIRHMKQFREGPEFFYDSWAGELSPITASMKKLGGKASPMAHITAVLLTGKTVSGFPVRELRDKEGWQKVAAMSKYLATTWLPFSFSALREERKEFNPIQFAFPTSRGMSAYKTRKLFKTALQKENTKFLKKVWNAAIDNNIPEVHKIFDQAVRELRTAAEEEYRAELRKQGVTEKQLDKIKTKQDLMAAAKEIRKLVRMKRSIEKQRNMNIMEKKLEGYYKRKEAMETELKPGEKKKYKRKFQDIAEENRINKN